VAVRSRALIVRLAILSCVFAFYFSYQGSNSGQTTMRIILYTGKGGVGKTSIAAATGLKLADLGYRTIVISLDAAHSLSDIFDKEKRLADSGEDKLIQINDKLWIQEIDIQQAIIDYWESVHSYMRALLNQSGLDEIVAEEIAIFPGMEEICALLYINQYVREEAYDVIILDCAPTGESLRFVSIPTTLEWYMNHLFKLERNLVKVVRPVVERLSSVQLPRDNYFQNIQDLFDQLHGIDHILTDPKITTVRLVTNPEKVVIKETQRAFMYFCLYGLCIDAVIINRIIPDTVDSPFFEGWKRTQQNYINDALNYFSEVPVWKAYLFNDEIVGEAGLRRLSESLYTETNPADIFFDKKPYQFSKDGNQYQVSVHLPFITKEDIDLAKHGDELIVRIGGFKQYVVLPRSIVHANPTSAELVDGRLLITFTLPDQ
jgi:arsenite-transporting ATPase